MPSSIVAGARVMATRSILATSFASCAVAVSSPVGCAATTRVSDGPALDPRNHHADAAINTKAAATAKTLFTLTAIPPTTTAGPTIAALRRTSATHRALHVARPPP